VIYYGYTGTRIAIKADSLDEAYEKLTNEDYKEIEVESWIEDGDDTYATTYTPETE
jgi:hypothetical protein